IDVHGDVGRICPDAPAPVLDEQERRCRPGGAGLAAAATRYAAGAATSVQLLTALGQDPAGQQIRQLLEKRGVQVIDLGAGGSTVRKIRHRSGGHTLLRLDQGHGPEVADPDVPADAAEAIDTADALLIADYGLGLLSRPTLRTVLEAADAPI